METYSTRDALARNLAAMMEMRPDLDTQVKVAARSGVGQSTIGRILRAEVSATLDNVQAIAEAFGVPADVLISAQSPQAGALDAIVTGLAESALQQLIDFAVFLSGQAGRGTTSDAISFVETRKPGKFQAQITRANTRPPGHEPGIGQEIISKPRGEPAAPRPSVRRSKRRG